MVAVVLGVVLLLLPSGFFAWRYRTMPQLGAYHDDAVYWISAQALAHGDGYVVNHLPEKPAQTKYPPLYPAVLATIWVVAGNFPANLKVLAALQWSFVPIVLLLGWLFFRRCGFSAMACYLMTAVIAAGPMTVIFGTAPMTELPFTALLLTVFLILEGERELTPKRAFFAGLFAAATFLTRTNGIVLAASVPVLLLWRRKFGATLSFLAPLCAAIAGWQVWCSVHKFPATDLILSYYTSYLGFYIQNFSWAEFPNRMWVNADAIIEGLPRLILFSTGADSMGLRIAAWVMTAAAVAGAVALFRSGLRHYVLFAGLFIGMLVVWEYPPDPRFLYPLLPLYLAGLFTKLSEVGKLGLVTWRKGGLDNRTAAAFVLSIIVSLGVGCAVSLANGLIRVLPAFYEEREKERDQLQPTYRWIASNTPQNARFAAYDDTMLFLYTGRHGYTVPILPPLVYANDSEGVAKFIGGLDSLWREKNVTYVLVTRDDFQRDFHEPAQAALRRLVADRSRFEPVYTDAAAEVYRLLQPPANTGSD
ncbi:MAG: hypothetical protein JO022_15645 [Acidobacteriaceae bacterium]|nr:hypothetical protein [Acidobacteriaceae bacterium]